VAQDRHRWGEVQVMTDAECTHRVDSEIQATGPAAVLPSGIRIAYDTFGERGAPALVLIAGLGDQLLSWPVPFCEQLAARGLYVIRFDNRDVGLSTTFREAGAPALLPLISAYLRGRIVVAPYTVHDMAADTVGLLDALGIAQAHVLGSSLGGMIAQAVAAGFPDRVRSLILLMTTALGKALPLPRPKTIVLFLPPKPGRDQAAEHLVRVMRAVRGSRFPSNEEHLRREAGLRYDRAHGSRGAARQLAAIIASARGLSELAPTIAASTLVIHGSDDPVIPLPHGQRLAQVIPGARLHVVEGLGHELPPGAWPEIVESIASHTAAPNTS